jgi:hypothetical protein
MNLRQQYPNRTMDYGLQHYPASGPGSKRPASSFRHLRRVLANACGKYESIDPPRTAAIAPRRRRVLCPSDSRVCWYR